MHAGSQRMLRQCLNAVVTCICICFSSSSIGWVGTSSWRLFPIGIKFSPVLNHVAVLGYVLFSFSDVHTNLNLLKFEFQMMFGSQICFLVSLHSTTTMISTAARNRASTGRQQASTRKRKTSSVLIDKNINDVTKCKDFFKSNDGIALCSDLVSMRMKSGKNLSRKEMAAINATLDYTSKYGQEFASDQCPAGGDVSWLAARDTREQIEQELFTVENESTARKTPRFDPESILNKILEFNKEHVSKVKKRERRSKSKTNWYSSSEEDYELEPFPMNEVMFEFEEAMEHLDKAKSRDTLIKHWISLGFIPVSKSQCAKLWKKRDVFKKTGSGKPPKAWKVMKGRPQLATTPEFIQACQEMEKDGHMALSKSDVHSVLVDISKKRSTDKKEWKSDTAHQPDRHSVDRYFALHCDRRAKKLCHGKVLKKTMTRFTGEHSLRSSASFAGVEASIGLIVGEDERPTRFKKSIEAASDGAQKLERIVREANDGESVYPVQPGMQFTFDDTTVFGFEGDNNNSEKGEWKLLDPEESYSARSAYSVDTDGSESSQFRGQRVRLSFTMSGNGRVGSIWATRAGLSESELPSDVCPSGIHITEVPGLTIGGSDIMQEGPKG